MRTLLALLICSLPLFAQPKTVFKEGKHDGAELKFVEGLAVLTVKGKPKEIGEQMGVLIGKNAPSPVPVLERFLEDINRKGGYPLLKLSASGLKKNFSADHLAEMEAFAKTADYELEMLVALDTLYDLTSGLGCSTLIVEKERSGTKGPLFGRNFDWIPSKGLPGQTLILVMKPEGKRAFASITWAPITGLISGMNDAGLCVTINEVLLKTSKDQSKFDWAGVPTMMAFRRVLEECKNLDDAEKLLKGMKRMTAATMSACDETGGAIFEITPKEVIRRKPSHGIGCATNHFVSDELGTGTKVCPRLDTLLKVKDGKDSLDVSAVFDRLHQVHQKKATLQSMVFEPTERILHLKVGDALETATKLDAIKLDLKPLLAK